MTQATFQMDEDLFRRHYRPKVSSIINNMLPDELRGKIVDITQRRSERLFSRMIIVTVLDGNGGTESINFQAPDMTQEMDLYESIVKRVVAHFNEKQGS